MLYNPKWSKNLTLSNFLFWVEAKDPKESYNFRFCRLCAVGKWLAENGVPDEEVGAWSAWHKWPNVLTANSIAGVEPHNFGALAKRLRAALR